MLVRAMFFDFTIFDFFLSGATHYEAYYALKNGFYVQFEYIEISLPIGNRYNYYRMVTNRNNRNKM